MEIIAGVDEVGRGPLAGPVIAAAVILPEEHSLIGLKDSKKLTKKRREELYPLIIEQAMAVGIGSVDVKTIDKINIREATFLAMNKAIENLSHQPDKLLVDGYPLKNQKIPNEGIIKGDDKIDSIKAASIIAKVTRDRLMVDYSRIFPEYGFESNSGYGTKVHLEALNEYKATPIHRRSFSPVKNSMPSMKWLSDNNRISWMCQKLVALYLNDNGYKICELNRKISNSNRIDIIANYNQFRVYLKIFQMQNEENSSDKIEENKIKKSIQLINQEDEYFDQYRVDYIYIKLKKNKSPEIKHLEGIQLD